MKKSSSRNKKISSNKKHQQKVDKEQHRLKNDAGKSEQNAAPKNPKLFYFILILIPILFFFLLEISLRIFNYGYDLSQWIEISSNRLVLNGDIGKRYFYNTDFKPKTSDDSFDKIKSPNSFRVFVLGGSSAAGFPFMPLGSFSSYVKRRLELSFPDTRIEVINISMTAVNSYTILDLIPGVLDQEPDLILIYAGHNEYYGALGVGSVESLGSSRLLKKSVLFLNNFKTSQLIKDFLSMILSLFSEDIQIKDDATLMSRMAEKKSIELDSEIFKKGIEQFSDNLSEILELITAEKVPVIIGNLVSNYKDQKPFISIDAKGKKSADQVFAEAWEELDKSNYVSADSLFRMAKDLDALRFRAPEKISGIIKEMSLKYSVPVAACDSMLNANSPDGIIGNNFMIDHLHPNVKGYQLIGKAYYEKMHKFNYLPTNKEADLSFEKQDSITIQNFIFTDLDSSIGLGIVKLLKNDWPFTEKKSNTPKSVIINPRTLVDSISLKYIENTISYVDAYFEIASANLKKDNFHKYNDYINTLIYRYPGLKDVNTTVKYFYQRGKVNPKDYTPKRLGIISALNENYDEAIANLKESYKNNPEDTGVLYYLTFSYIGKNDYRSAEKFLAECLRISPDDKKCLALKNKILAHQTAAN